MFTFRERERSLIIYSFGGHYTCIIVIIVIRGTLDHSLSLSIYVAMPAFICIVFLNYRQTNVKCMHATHI